MSDSTSTHTNNAKTILLVDDDPDFLFQQKVFLQQAGYEVATAAGEREAEEYLEKQTPDLAVLDLMMENADGGFALSYHIKKNYPGVPVVLVSSVSNQTGLDFRTGGGGEQSWIKVDAMLAKPIRFEQLQGEIDRLLPGAV